MFWPQGRSQVRGHGERTGSGERNKILAKEGEVDGHSLEVTVIECEGQGPWAWLGTPWERDRDGEARSLSGPDRDKQLLNQVPVFRSAGMEPPVCGCGVQIEWGGQRDIEGEVCKG